MEDAPDVDVCLQLLLVTRIAVGQAGSNTIQYDPMLIPAYFWCVPAEGAYFLIALLYL